MPKKKQFRKKKNSVSRLFVPAQSTKHKGDRVRCIFCDLELPHNGTRMKTHINKCNKCDDSVKLKYLQQEKPEATADSMEIDEIVERARAEQQNFQQIQPEEGLLDESITIEEDETDLNLSRADFDNKTTSNRKEKTAESISTSTPSKRTPSISSFFSNVSVVSGQSGVGTLETVSFSESDPTGRPESAPPDLVLNENVHHAKSRSIKKTFPHQSGKLNLFMDNITDAQNVSILII